MESLRLTYILIQDWYRITVYLSMDYFQTKCLDPTQKIGNYLSDLKQSGRNKNCISHFIKRKQQRFLQFSCRISQRIYKLI